MISFSRTLRVTLVLAVPSLAVAWGSTAHRLINEYAVDDLPDAMWNDGSNNGFNAWRAYLRTHASDPDTLRSSGRDAQEGPRHFCDIDSQIAQYPSPFSTVPRDYNAYVAAFDRDNGVVMWEGISEHADGLRVALKTRNWAAAKQAAADLGHYVGDAHSPFHGTANFDGQFTGNNGIHARHESELVSRYFTSADMVTRRTNPAAPGTVQNITNLVEFGFTMIVEDRALTLQILQADNAAKAIDASYGDAYFEAFYDDVGELTLNQINTAARRLADVWYTSWVAAGQPDFALAPKASLAPIITPTVDGTLTEFTGTALLQTNTTETGLDNLVEIDQLFAGSDAQSLHLGVAGNVGLGYALIVLLDTKPGGSTSLFASTPSYLSAMNGATWDSGFAPDYALAIERTASGRAVRLANLVTPQTALLGSFATGASFALSDGGAVAFNDTNTGGVKDRNGRTVGDCENVRKGIEITIREATLGMTPGAAADVRVLAFVVTTAGAQTNQFLPGMPLGAFAETTSRDFRDRQYGRFTIQAAAPAISGTGLRVY